MKEIYLKLYLKLLINPVTITVVLLLLAYYLVKRHFYKKTTYYKITHNGLLNTIFNTGRHGEYQIYKYLKNFEKRGCKFLFNIYVPTPDEKTSEIDVLLITPKGLYVFESKNYSGWIFGKETEKNWTQVLPQGKGRKSRKGHFYNPIMQNETHISNLRKYLNDDETPMHSIIVFSERCTLKDVQVLSSEIMVINRYNVSKTVSNIYDNSDFCLSDEKLAEIERKLYPFSQVDDAKKLQHIENIQMRVQKNNISNLNERNIIEKDNTLPILNSDTTTVNGNNELICPKCGSVLLKRMAKRGSNKGLEFYGCSNFPRCKYIKKNDIDEKN